MTEMILTRCQKLKDRTLGSLVVNDLFGFAVLELPWRDNKTNISCIPEGVYQCRVRTSTKYGKHIEVLKVPGRSNILIHFGNYPKDTRGCLLIGDRFSDLDGDGVKEVANSKKAIQQLVKICERENGNIILEIVDGNA